MSNKNVSMSEMLAELSKHAHIIESGNKCLPKLFRQRDEALEEAAQWEARFWAVVEVLKRDNYGAAFMTDDEIIEQVDGEIEADAEEDET